MTPWTRVWPWLPLAVALPVSLDRGLATLASALVLAALAAGLAWKENGLLATVPLAASVPLITLLEPLDAVLPGLLLATALTYAFLGHQAVLLVVGPASLLLPGPAAIVGPPILAAGLVASSRGRVLWLAAGIALLPLLVTDPILAGLLAATALIAGLVVRGLTGSPANLAMARRTALLGLAAMVAPAALGVAYTATVPIETFWPAARLATLALVAGLVLGLAHLGLASRLVTRQRPALPICFTWVPVVLLLVNGLRGDLASMLGPLSGVLAVTGPWLALGVVALVRRSRSHQAPAPGPA